MRMVKFDRVIKVYLFQIFSSQIFILATHYLAQNLNSAELSTEKLASGLSRWLGLPDSKAAGFRE